MNSTPIKTLTLPQSQIRDPLSAFQIRREVSDIKRALADLPVFLGVDEPEGLVPANVGSLFLLIQNSVGKIFIKRTGEGIASGWVEITAGNRGFLSAWVTDSRQIVSLGSFPDNAFVFDINVHVVEAFNSGGTDLLTVGWDTDRDALMTSLNVAVTGVKVVAYGVSLGFNSIGQELKAYYSAGGSAPTTGKALILVEYGISEEDPL